MTVSEPCIGAIPFERKAAYQIALSLLTIQKSPNIRPTPPGGVFDPKLTRYKRDSTDKAFQVRYKIPTTMPTAKYVQPKGGQKCKK